jgi:cytochrome c oxidase assembly protein subunit 15
VLTSSALHRYAQVTVGAAFFVIFAGAMVTSTGSGMAVPDWPTSFGTWMPKMEGGVFYEHGHRMVAAAAGCRVTVLALWSQFSGQRPMVRRLCWYAFLAIVAQGIVGGTTVMLGTQYGLDHTSPVFSVLHASLAQALFAILVVVAAVTAPGWLAMPVAVAGDRASSLRPLALGLVLVVYVQIILGAVMRHENAGLMIPDFPLSYGKLVPDIQDWRVGLNYSHRVGALLVLVVGTSLAVLVLKRASSDWIKVPAKVLIAALLLQVTLGACAVWSRLQPVLTSAHVIGGAFVLASSVVLALRIFRIPRQDVV